MLRFLLDSSLPAAIMPEHFRHTNPPASHRPTGEAQDRD